MILNQNDAWVMVSSFLKCLALFLLGKIVVVVGTGVLFPSGPAMWLVSICSFLFGTLSVLFFCRKFICCKVTMRGAAGALFLFSAGGFLIYFPDTLAAFSSEVSLLFGLALTVLAWLVVSLLVFSLRLPLLFFRNSPRALLLYVLALPLFELGLLFVFPLAYFGSMPVPVPPGAFFSAGKFGASGTLTVLVDPRFDEELRLQAAQEAQGFELKESWSFLNDLFSNIERQRDEQVLQMLWPETMFAVGPAGLQTIFAGLEKRALEKGFHRLELVAGVGSALENKVLHTTRLDTTGRIRFRQVGEKMSGVPLFETNVMGLAVYAMETRAGENEYWSDLERPNNSRDALALLQNSNIKICYDALFPQARQFGQKEVIFTNHHIFSRFKIASLTYDYVLRLLGLMLQNEVLLVANQGSSGLVDSVGAFSHKDSTLENNKGRFMIWRRHARSLL